MTILDEAVANIVERHVAPLRSEIAELKRQLASQDKPRVTLAQYLEIGRKAAAARIARCAELRALGRADGRGGALTFDRGELDRYFTAKGRR